MYIYKPTLQFQELIQVFNGFSKQLYSNLLGIGSDAQILKRLP